MSNQNVVDRIAQRLKGSNVGEFFTDEDLYEIVKGAIPQVFFEPVIEQNGSYSTIKKPPIIHTMMKEALEKQIREMLDKWAKDNAEKILEMWKPILEQGVVKYTQEVVNNMATYQIKNALNTWVDQINNDKPFGQMIPRIL